MITPKSTPTPGHPGTVSPNGGAVAPAPTIASGDANPNASPSSSALSGRRESIWIRLKRSMGLIAPLDGICTEKTWRRTTYERYDSIHEYTTHYRCTKPWGHKDDNHTMDRVEEPA